MQQQLSTLEQVTCYAIIIALVISVLKQCHYPLGTITRSLNPFRNRQIINQMSERLDDCELEKYNQNQVNIEVKKRLKKIEKTIGIKQKKKNARTD